MLGTRYDVWAGNVLKPIMRVAECLQDEAALSGRTTIERPVSYLRIAVALLAFVIGALSDVLLIRNGLSLSGPTLLDTYPAIWAAWLAAVLVSSFLLEFAYSYSRSRRADLVPPAREFIGSSDLLIPLAILLGMVVTHTTLLLRDVILDPSSHNLWPFEYLFWGFAIAVPAFIGSILARLTFHRAWL
jgi:hypothetical protein